jgi:sugar phosphate permease
LEATVGRYRWTVLAVGTAAQASYSAIWFGVAVMAPALRARYGLSLGQAGVLISGSLAGSVLSLIPWGIAADRLGERLVLGLGLAACGGALLAAAHATGFLSLAALLVLAGTAGASVQSASGRAVMQWFGAAERGLALGIRQTAIPIGGLATSLGLPHLLRAGGVGWGFSALGVACIATGLTGAFVIREAPRSERLVSRAGSPFRDARMWALAGGSALVVAPQMCLLGFTVLFLHDRRGLSASSAAAVLAVVQVLGIAARIAAGQWSDRMRTRLRPLRLISLAVAAIVALTTAVLFAPMPVFLPALVVAGALSMSWNGLAFAAAAEIAGYSRSGAAIGLQQTVLNGFSAIVPGVFGALVAATSWRLGFGVLAFFPLAGWRVLGLVRG